MGNIASKSSSKELNFERKNTSELDALGWKMFLYDEIFLF